LARGKTVLATGVFDILHTGHLRFLEESRKRGGPGARLVVVIARDKTIRKRKGRNPVLPEGQRREIVAFLKPVYKAILGPGREQVDFLGILQTVKPDIVCVGYDQNGIKRSVKRIITREKLPVRLVQLPRFGLPGLNSSTGIKRRVLNNRLIV
jgi:FAD synthetase